MNIKLNRVLALITVICIISVLLLGCDSEQIMEVIETETDPVLENQQDLIPQDFSEMPEIPTAEDISENISELIQAGLNAVATESDLWSIAEITDSDVLMQLMQAQGGGRGRPEGESFDGERPESMTPPNGEFAERTDGEIPNGTMPQQDGEKPQGGSFPEGQAPEGEQVRSEGGGRLSSNRANGMTALAIMISYTEEATIAIETVLEEIETTAQTLGYRTTMVEITAEQAALLEISEDYAGSAIVLVSTQMPEMVVTESAG